MEIITEDIGEQRKAIRIKVSPEDYKAKVQSGLKEKQKNIIIPGFRKGMVPIDYIKKYYGKSLLFDEITKLVPQTIESYVKDNNLNIIGQAIPTKENYDIGDDWNLDSVFDFEFELGLVPDINLDQTFDEQITKYIVDVTDEMIDFEIANFRRRYSKFSKPDSTREDDYTFGEFIELDLNNNEKENGIRAKSVYALELVKDVEQKKKFINLKVDEEVIFDLVDLIKNESEISHLLNIKKDEIKNLSSNFKFIVKEITRLDKPELSQENFNKWFGEGKVNGIEEFREYFKNQIGEQYISSTEGQLKNDMKEYLLNKLNPYIPFEYVKKMLKYNNEEKWNDQKVEERHDEILKSYKWNFIEKAIINKFDLAVSDEELKSFIYQITLYRMEEKNMDMTQENYNKLFDEIVKNEDEMELIHDNYIQFKIFHSLSNFLKIETVTLPFELYSTKITYKQYR